MARKTITLNLSCPTCRAAGEFVYDRQHRLFARDSISFRRLTRGFTSRNTAAHPLTITCTGCGTIVLKALTG